MCGIAGIYSFAKNYEPINPVTIDTMRDTMIHRGPDGAGTWVSEDGRIGLGHRRLSIIDLSELANQPMSDHKKDIWIVYNGEIYNHAELRKTLETIGYSFKTDHSDTEVIIYSFLEWGIECINKFRGMFAFSIWDERKKELWLVRDRLGVKPLYYTVFNNKIIFASEIKAILSNADVKREIDEEALFHYLSFLAVPAPKTMFKGINKLRGGSWLKVDFSGEVEEKIYWDPLDADVENKLADTDLAKDILDELREAVRLRKVSDVPVGVFLSGGIDSSTNTALFSKDESHKVKTFSVGYDQDYPSYTSELGFARDMANHIGTEHHEIKLTRKDLEEFLPKMVAMQDEPIADPVCVPLYYVSKLAHENGVTVCQVGEGADELFCGYPNWKRAILIQHLNNKLPIPNFVKKLAYKVISILGYDYKQTAEYLRRASLNQPIFWGGAEVFTHADKTRLLSEDIRKKYSDKTSWIAIEPIYKRFLEKTKENSSLNWMTYLDLNLRLPELLLMRADKMSMAVSIEARVPFLDHKLVEKVLAIPMSKKLKDGDLKYLLKLAVKNIIPDRIINRPKQGFGLPLHEWLLDGLGDKARQHVDDFAKETGLLDPKGVEKIFERKEGDVRVWILLNLALWWKHYFKNELVKI